MGRLALDDEPVLPRLVEGRAAGKEGGGALRGIGGEVAAGTCNRLDRIKEAVGGESARGAVPFQFRVDNVRGDDRDDDDEGDR
jgi:hypothetical protein